MADKELYDKIGKRISLLNEKLFKAKEEPKEEDLKLIHEAITFLHDHKYRLLNQGLNQIEYIINEAHDKLKEIEEKFSNPSPDPDDK